MPKSADEQLADIARYLNQLHRGEIHRSEKRLRYELATKIAARVRGKYRQYIPMGTPTGIAAATARAGKKKGAERPARMPHEPINIFEILARHTQVVKEAQGYRVRARGIAPDIQGGRFTRGTPLYLISHWIENPRSYKIRMSLRQLAYLIMVREGRGGYKSRRSKRAHLPNQLTQYFIVIKPPDRPVWRAVAAEMAALVQMYYRNPYFKILKRVGRRYGMI
jgi:hypothetical protein